MESIILISSDKKLLDKLATLNYKECKNKYFSSGKETLVIEFADNKKIFFDDYDKYFNYEYDENEIEKINANLPFSEKHFYSFSYHNLELMKKIINQEDFPSDIFIDDSNGNIMRINDFRIR